MKYFVYISDTKLDMLAGQLDPKILRRMARELKVDLKVVSLTLKDDPQDDTRYSKLRVVERCLQKDDEVGTISSPAKWFGGSESLAWGTVGTQGEVVYFTNIVSGTLLGLTGSGYHLIGGTYYGKGSSWVDTDRERYAPGGSFMRTVVEHEMANHLGVAEEGEEIRFKMTTEAVVGTMLQIHDRLGGHAERLDFVAKTLLDVSVSETPGLVNDYYLGRLPPFDRILLGTPLYVAMAV